jgi:hypothetical protein
MRPTAFPVVRALNVAGLAVYVAWSPENVERYTLAGYDRDGCLVDEETFDLGPGGMSRPGETSADCPRHLPEADAVEALVDGR